MTDPEPTQEHRDLERLFQSALHPPARPLTAQQIAQVQNAAGTRAGGSVPAWALAGLVLGLVLLAGAGLLSTGDASLLGTAALLVPLANLAGAPFAALAIIRRRRRKNHEH